MTSPKSPSLTRLLPEAGLRSLVTPKDFKWMPRETALNMRPTGVHEYHRVELRTVLPELGSVNLWVFYHLRVACCAYQQVRGAGDVLADCDRCHDNRGFVCPTCLGATFVRKPFRFCPTCTYDTTGEKGKLVTLYDPEKELLAARAWLARRFPLGLPSELDPEDILRFDAN